MPENKLYYGDNLDVLRRYVTDESVDLVYLDPPFNSRQDYNVLFKEKDGTTPPRRSWPLRTPGSGTPSQRRFTRS
jgi:16S rRNA G966 N2-methylase RsmD